MWGLQIGSLSILLQSVCEFLELFATVFHIPEEVKAGATWGEQHGISGCSKPIAGFHTVFHGMCFSNWQSQWVEEVMEFAVRITNNEELMKSIREKAIKRNKTLEKAIEDDATWVIRRKYGLDHCMLIVDPDAEIPVAQLK